MSGLGGLDRLARRQLARAKALTVPDTSREADALAPVEFAFACGLRDPDEWQAKVLTSTARKQILVCSRQSGKSTTTAIVALEEAAYVAGALVLVLSPSQKQSSEFVRKAMAAYQTARLSLSSLPGIIGDSALRIELDNGSRVIALPGNDTTVRGYSACSLLLVDEAARVPDALMAAARPTIATTNGRIILLSTPAGKRGFFWDTWSAGEEWERTLITATDCPRISPKFLEDERRDLGEFQFQQEYLCAWLDAETSVFSSELIAAAFSNDLEPLWPDSL